MVTFSEVALRVTMIKVQRNLHKGVQMPDCRNRYNINQHNSG